MRIVHLPIPGTPGFRPLRDRPRTGFEVRTAGLALAQVASVDMAHASW
jgi:hypothetical protein